MLRSMLLRCTITDAAAFHLCSLSGTLERAKLEPASLRLTSDPDSLMLPLVLFSSARPAISPLELRLIRHYRTTLSPLLALANPRRQFSHMDPLAAASEQRLLPFSSLTKLSKP